MGMYTEFNLRFEVKEDTPVADFLLKWVNEADLGFSPREIPDSEKDHPFFKTERWSWFPGSQSFYFPTFASESKAVPGQFGGVYVSLVGSIKNYSGEIGHFVDWIKPHIVDHGFFGYSLYEEATTPTLYFNDLVR